MNRKRMLRALEAMLNDYRSDGCAEPNCRLCKKSKAARELAEAAVRNLRKERKPRSKVYKAKEKK